MNVVQRREQYGRFSPIEDIIADAQAGRMFILVDAEDRENEGDLIIPAQMAGAEAINFMARWGRGLICLALTSERAQKLRLELMARSNQARHSTAFTVSIEAREGVTTGISAHDRARTIAVAIDPEKDYRDVVSPGHIFPLVARDGGALVRAGHTEAAVDIARLAGLYPAGVICEIMNDDGAMARVPDLMLFAGRHNLRIATIADLIAYRRRYDSLLRIVEEAPVTSLHGGAFIMKVYRSNVDGKEHVALVKGDVATGGPALVRVHAVNPLEDILGVGCGGDRHALIARSMEAIAREGRGVLVLIRGLYDMSGLLHQYAADSAGGARPAGDPREGQDGAQRLMDYGVGAQILLDLGVRDMILLSNSPTPKVVALDGYGLGIVGRRRIDE